MKIYETLKKSMYAILFGFMGLIIGIWTADLLYNLVLKGLERVTTSHISIIIILLITIASLVLGFTKGKSLLE